MHIGIEEEIVLLTRSTPADGKPSKARLLNSNPNHLLKPTKGLDESPQGAPVDNRIAWTAKPERKGRAFDA